MPRKVFFFKSQALFLLQFFFLSPIDVEFGFNIELYLISQNLVLKRLFVTHIYLGLLQGLFFTVKRDVF